MAYCTNTEIKTYLNITGTGDDTLLTNLAAAAKAAIDSWCKRTFEAASDTTRYFDGRGDHIGRPSQLSTGRTHGLRYRNRETVLYLDEDLCAITTVTNGDGVEVTSSQYTTLPRNDTPYYAIQILSDADVVWTYDDEYMDAISILGKWAYSESAPEDIKRACIFLAGYYHKKRANPTSEMVVTPFGQLAIPAGMPNHVVSMLAPYRKEYPNLGLAG